MLLTFLILLLVILDKNRAGWGIIDDHHGVDSMIIMEMMFYGHFSAYGRLNGSSDLRR